MGLFDKFKREPISPDTETVLRYIAGKDGLGSIKGQSVCINMTGLTVTVPSCKAVEKDGQYTAYVLFEIDRDDFDDKITEPQTALGDTRENALKAAAEQFVSILLSITLSIGLMKKGEGLKTLENSFGGSRHVYYYPETLPVSRLGNTKGRSRQPFELVRDEIADYLGGRKYNCLKLFVGRVGEKVDCEARLNGMLVPELSKKLRGLAESDEEKTAVLMEKQCILFVQGDDTYKPPRHSIEKIRKCAEKAIPILAEMHDDASWQKGFRRINLITHDYILTHEMIHYLPEAAAQIMFSEVKTVTPITLYFGENGELTLNRTQLTAWCGASDAIEEYYHSKRPEDKFMFAVMDDLSSLYSAVCQIMQKHPNVKSLSGLTFSELGCNMPEEYRHQIY